MAATCTDTRSIGFSSMIAPLAYGLMVAGLVLAAWTGMWAVWRRPANQAQLVGCLVLEGGLCVQSVIAVFRIIAGADVAETATFIAYALGVLVPLALGVYLGRVERTRWGSIGVCFTAVVVAVMTLRLLQLWRMGVTDV
jgi:hypothetical protein